MPAKRDIRACSPTFDGNEKVIKEEIFYTDAFANEKGLSRSITYLDGNNGKPERDEYFFTDRFGDKKGVKRKIVYRSGDGKVTREDLFYTDKFAK